MSIKFNRIKLCAGRPREFDVDEALEKAMNVFHEKGFEGASLPDLTTAMGISRPSVYATFGNKEELFLKALDRYYAEGMKLFHTALAEPTAYGTVEKMLMGVADGSACPSKPKGCLMVLGALGSSDGAQIIKQELAVRRSHIESLLRQRFERAIAEGDVPANTSAFDLAGFITTVIHGMKVQSANGVGRESLQGIAQMALKAVPASAK